MKRIKKTHLYILGALVIGVLLGALLFNNSSADSHGHEHETAAEKETIWTCSMHPQIRQNEPGQCPICGMDLIPLSDNSNQKESEVKMSAYAMKLAEVMTQKADSMIVSKKLRLTGKVQPDERKVLTQATHLSGRIDKLLVNFTGEYVREGQVIAYIYSPELVRAQAEVFEARKIKAEQPALYRAAIQKLRNWKLTEKQIEEIEQADHLIESFPVRAERRGYISKKWVQQGDYVKEGEALFDVTDLSSVWVLFDVYESDLPWISAGDSVRFTVKSLPGEDFRGVVEYIDPAIDPQTRVARARVALKNPEMKLKPEMFATGHVFADGKSDKKVLAVPETAVLWTGERSVVYVKTRESEGIYFKLREVRTGASFNDMVPVLEGLEAGEEVAVQGAFSIDAAAQLAGKPSMMSEQTKGIRHNHASNKINLKSGENDRQPEVLRDLLNRYLAMKNALVEDDFKRALSEADKLRAVVHSVKNDALSPEFNTLWSAHGPVLRKSLAKVAETKDIDALRLTFKHVSDELIRLFSTAGNAGDMLFVNFCPMAVNDSGASWISKTEAIQNPYFGQSMLKCGEITQRID